jgi:hypothetical protein
MRASFRPAWKSAADAAGDEQRRADAGVVLVAGAADRLPGSRQAQYRHKTHSPAACAPGMPDAQAIADQKVMLQLLM